MATISEPLRNALAARAVQNLDVLEILDSGGIVLATFSGLTWGAPASGVVTVQGLPVEVTASASGTATTARLRHSGTSGESVDGLSVGTSGMQVVMANTNIAQGQPVRLQSVQFTQDNQVV